MQGERTELAHLKQTLSPPKLKPVDAAEVLEELVRVFQEVYRSEATEAQAELGTGLGLPIANKIVKLYQGTMEVDSVPGQRTTFSLRLPSVSTGRLA